MSITFDCGCDTQRAPLQPDQTARLREGVKVNVTTAVRDEATVETIITYGKLTPLRASQLQFGRGGRVEKVSAGTGSRVEQGELLASLEQGELTTQREQILQSLTKQQSELQFALPARASAIQKQIAELQERQTAIEAELANGLIKAPFAGIVENVEIEKGMPVPPQMPTFLLVEEAAPLVEVMLTDSTASLLSADQQISTQIAQQRSSLVLKSRAALRGPIAGERVLLEFSNELPPDTWAYGDVVELRIEKPISAAVYRLPVSALQREAGRGWSVYVAETSPQSSDTTFRVARRTVDVKLLQGTAALVEGALAVGDLVIIDGTHRIVPGQRILPAEIPSAGEAAGDSGVPK